MIEFAEIKVYLSADNTVLSAVTADGNILRTKGFSIINDTKTDKPVLVLEIVDFDIELERNE